MNRKQRNKNRGTSLALHYECPPKHACPECGELTHHGHYFPPCFGDEGFWTCSKFYGEDGRRLVDERPPFIATSLAGVWLDLLASAKRAA